MPLPKHIRPRWRYLAVTIETPAETDLDRRAFQAAVWSDGRALLGDPGSADADLSVIRFEFDAAAGAGTALVRARRSDVGPARAAIACVDAVEGCPVGLTVEGIGGTVRACEQKYLARPPDASHTEVEFEERRRQAVVRDDAVDLTDGDTFTGATTLDAE